jgi:hypothetical protein
LPRKCHTMPPNRSVIMVPPEPSEVALKFATEYCPGRVRVSTAIARSLSRGISGVAENAAPVSSLTKPFPGGITGLRQRLVRMGTFCPLRGSHTGTWGSIGARQMSDLDRLHTLARACVQAAQG